MITHHAVTQGTQEWLDLRCGLLTASEMHLIMTPKLKTADNDKSRAHLYELLAQRITKHVEPHYISDDMLRGHDDEVRARAAYQEDNPTHLVEQVGFITREFTRDVGGEPVTFTLGYSPDALVAVHLGDAIDYGQLECKSRRQKYQIQTALETAGGTMVPVDFQLQVQTGLLVTGRRWCDFVSYSGGLPMVVNRERPDSAMQDAILDTSARFEARLQGQLRVYSATVAKHGWRMTERSTNEIQGSAEDNE